MYLCAMSKVLLKQKFRENLLLGWFHKGGYTLPQICEMMNTRLPKPVTERTIDADIKRIKEQLQQEAMVLLNEKGFYRIADAKGLANMDKTEKRMIPLVETLLKPYSIVPGVERILDEIKTAHNIGKGDASVLKNAVAFTSPHIVMNERVKELVLSLLNFMFSGEVCAFHYNDVFQRSEANKLILVCPLQIRESLGRLYLIAQAFDKPLEQKYLRVYAIDCIKGLKVDRAADLYENEHIQQNFQFDYTEMTRSLNLQSHFDGVVGIWRPPSVEPTEITRYFAGWALSHIEACPLHTSQILLNVSKEKILLNHLKKPEAMYVGLIKFKVHKTPELSFRLASYRDYSWAAHFGPNGPTEKLNWDFED